VPVEGMILLPLCSVLYGCITDLALRQFSYRYGLRELLPARCYRCSSGHKCFPCPPEISEHCQLAIRLFQAEPLVSA
jgi:hypothetical protein